MQTGRDAINALFNHTPAEHIPLHDSPWGDTLRKWVTQGMPAQENGAAVSAVEHFEFDMAGCGGWFDWQPKRGVTEIVEENEEWKVVRNGSGAQLKWWKDKSGTPEHVAFHMTDRAVWDREYKPFLTEFDPSRVNIDNARNGLKRVRDAGRWAFYGHQFIWENMRASLGDVTLYTSLLTDPGWIHDYCRTYTDLYKTAFKLLLDEAGVPDGVWIYEDLGYKNALFCSPDTLRELIFPYYAELVEFLHGYDLPVVLHSCGYQEPMIPLAIEAGFDGLNPMEVKAGNDILKYAELYGDRLAFVGGLDARILESGDRPRIQDGVIELLEGMKARGARYVYGSDHSLSTNIDYDDFLYSLEVYRAHRTY